MLLLLATPINKLYCTTLRTRNPDSRASITNCDNNSPQSLLVVKFHLTSKQKVFSFLMSCKTELGMLCAFHVTLMLALQYCWFTGSTNSLYYLHTQSHWRAILPAFQKCNRFWLHTECHPSTGMPLAGHHSAANSHWTLPGMDSKLPTKNKLMHAIIMTINGRSLGTKVAIKNT